MEMVTDLLVRVRASPAQARLRAGLRAMRGEQLTASDASVLGISPGEALSLRVRNGKLVRIVKTNALGMPSATRTACQNIHCAEGRCCWCTAFEVPPDCWCDACDIISSPGPGN